MLRHLMFLTLACALFLTACTQPPAQVVYKGSQYYGRETAQLGTPDKPKSYVSSASWENTSVVPQDNYATMATVAPTPSVGVSDLKPIRANNLPPPAVSASSFKPAPLPATTVKSLNDQHGSVAPANTLKLSLSEPKSTIQPAASEQAAAFIWPVNGQVINRFGKKDSGVFNDGINIAADEGEPIWAAADGEVIYAGNALKGYGNMAIVRHKDNWITSYAHASRLSVKKGDKIKQGELVGYVGTSGGVSKPQLQFAVRKGKTPVNPELYLSRDVASR